MAEQQDRIDLPQPAEINFDAIPTERLREMIAAGTDVVECHRVLSNSGGNIVGELLRGVDTFFEWDHYPDGDVYDTQTHSQFYYHAHPQELRSHEHGHFHTFLRPLGIPKGVRPAMVDYFKMPDDENDALSHLVAISMDKFGVPIRLFTTIRWVTGETWYAADDAGTMLDSFLIDHAQPTWPVNRWVSGMVRLFRPQIVALIEARNAAIERWRKTYSDRNVFEDETFEITSMLDMDIDQQVARITELLETRA